MEYISCLSFIVSLSGKRTQLNEQQVSRCYQQFKNFLIFRSFKSCGADTYSSDDFIISEVTFDTCNKA